MTLELPDTQWRRVSPKYIVVDLVGTLIMAVIVVGGASIAPAVSGNAWLWFIPGSLAVVFLVTLAVTPRRTTGAGASG